MKKSYIFAIITVVIWATMAAVVKLILFDIPNLQALSISSYFAFAFLLVLNMKTGKIKLMRSYHWKDYGIIAGLGFMGLFVYSALYFYGLIQLSSQVACIVNYLWPIMLMIFSCIILKEKMTVMKGIAMACSFVGIVIISAGSFGTGQGNVAAGIISCVIAAVCYGLYSVLNKKADYDQNICQMIIWLVVAVCSMVLGLFTEEWVPIAGAQWLGILWLGIAIDAVAYLLWALALKHAENTAKIANLAFLVPFLSLVVSAVFLKEKIQAKALIALIFIVGGIIIQNFYEQLREKRRGSK